MLNFFSHGLMQHGMPGEVARDRFFSSSTRGSLTPLWSAGLRGEGEIVAVGDTGVDFDMCFFKDPAYNESGSGVPLNMVSAKHRKLVTVREFVPSNHGDERQGHGSHVAATIAGDAIGVHADAVLGSIGDVRLRDFNGAAPRAKLAVFDFGSARNLHIPLDALHRDLFTPAYASGARIMSNSWGDPSGAYDILSVDADRFVHENGDMLLVFACGNTGASRGLFGIHTPSYAKNVLSVGGSTAWSYPFGSSSGLRHPEPDLVAEFSSRGPTNDERVRPDVLAVGTIRSADSNGRASSEGFDHCSSRAGVLLDKHGTSMAAPVAAGHAALVRQALREGRFEGSPAEGFPCVARVPLVLLRSLAAARSSSGFADHRRRRC